MKDIDNFHPAEILTASTYFFKDNDREWFFPFWLEEYDRLIEKAYFSNPTGDEPFPYPRSWQLI